MTVITLPAYAYEEHLSDLLGLLGPGDDAGEISLDFKLVSFWTPGALVLLLAKTHYWLAKNKIVTLLNCETCSAFRYLQRVDFFSQCGIQFTEAFRRRETDGRFVELRRIGGSGASGVTDLSTDIAYCLFPDADVDDPDQSGLFDLLQYAVSELANNTVQHSRASGFAMAQYTARTDLIRVAVADFGIGILRSFQETGSPHWKPGLTDMEAIALALPPKVSSRSHLTTAWGESVNAGVGLTLLKEFSSRTGGQFFMASGSGVFFQNSGDVSPQQASLPSYFQGTICTVSFARARVGSFAELLLGAKFAAGLLPRTGEYGTLFT